MAPYHLIGILKKGVLVILTYLILRALWGKDGLIRGGVPVKYATLVGSADGEWSSDKFQRLLLMYIATNILVLRIPRFCCWTDVMHEWPPWPLAD